MSIKHTLLTAALLALAQSVAAATFSFAGNFSADTDVALFSFTLAQPTAGVELRTFGYAGGTNAAGQVIASGGFEPVLSLFLADGTQMNPMPSGPCGGVLPVDPSTGVCGDVDYTTERSFPAGVWQPGTYIAALSLSLNGSVGNFADGFFANAVLGLSNPSNFVCAMVAPGLADGAAFCDQTNPGVVRNGQWALDIIHVDSAKTVPLPSGISLFALSVGLMAWRVRAREASSLRVRI